MTPSSYDWPAVLPRLQEWPRDEGAWNRFVEAHHPALVRASRLMTGSRADAEDCAQETWVRVGNGIGRIDRNRPIRPFLFRVNHDVTVDFIRRKVSRRVRDTEFTERYARSQLTGPEDDPAELAAAAEAIARMAWLHEHAAVELDPKLYRVMNLRLTTDLSFAEIALELGLPTSTVQTQYSAAIRQMRAMCTSQEASPL